MRRHPFCWLKKIGRRQPPRRPLDRQARFEPLESRCLLALTSPGMSHAHVDEAREESAGPSGMPVAVDVTFTHADFNADHHVDGDDLALWKQGYSTGTTPAQGDANRDGKVDGLDFLAWQLGFGAGPADPIGVLTIDDTHSQLDTIEVATLDVDGTPMVAVNGQATNVVAAEVERIEVRGAEGNDTIDLGGVDPTSFPQLIDGEILIDGGAGSDSLTGSALSDTILGGSGADVLEGGGGNDDLHGSNDDDTYRFAGSEQLGIDAVVELPDGGNDTLDFSQLGQGIDLLDLGATSSSINTDLTLELSPGAIENVVGTEFGDTILGNSRGNVLIGGAGDDILDGKDGIDAIFGDSGQDTFLVHPSESYLEDLVVDSDQDIFLEDGSGNSNRIPAVATIIEPPEVVNTVDGSVLSVDLSAYVSDPDAGQSVTYLPVGSLPAGANLTSGGLFTWTPTIDQAGQVYLIEFEVMDDHAVIPLKDESQFWVQVDYAVPNQAPVIFNQTIPNPIDENSPNGTIVGTVAAFDPNAGDRLSFYIVGGNSDGIFAMDANGEITVADGSQLDYEQAESHELIVQVVDNRIPQLSDTAIVEIGVNDLPDGEAPVITSVPTVRVRLDQRIAFRIHATDAEDYSHDLTFLPTANWSQYASLTRDGVFSWEESAAGTYQVEVMVTDTDNQSSTQQIAIEVEDYNLSAPTITGYQTQVENSRFGNSPILEEDPITYSMPSVINPILKDRLFYYDPETADADRFPEPPELVGPREIRMWLRIAPNGQNNAIDDETPSSDLRFAKVSGPGSLSEDGYYVWEYGLGDAAKSHRVEFVVSDQGIGTTGVAIGPAKQFSGVILINVGHRKRDVEPSGSSGDLLNYSYSAPTARDERHSLRAGQTLTDQVFDSGWPPESTMDATQYQIVKGVEHGSLALDSYGYYEYTPDLGFNGIEAFSFQVTTRYPDYQEMPESLTSEEGIVTIAVGNVITLDIDSSIADENETDGDGQFVRFNGDDDNNNLIPDYLETQAVTGEDDLVAINLSTVWAENIENVYKEDALVNIASSNNAIRLWDSPNKGHEIIPSISGISGTTYLVEDLPSTIYVEGVTRSRVPVNLHLGLAKQPGVVGGTVGPPSYESDTIRLTVDSRGFDALFYRVGSGVKFDPRAGENEIVWNLDRDEGNTEASGSATYQLLDYMKDEIDSHAGSLNTADDELVRMDLIMQNWPADSAAEWMVDFTTDKVRLYYEDPDNDNQITELASGTWIDGDPGVGTVVASVYIEAVDKSTDLNDITIDPHVREVGTGITFHEENLLTSIVGDLSLLRVNPVQVVDNAPLVLGKETIASISFDWQNPFGTFTPGAWIDDVEVSLFDQGLSGPLTRKFSVYTIQDDLFTTTIARPYVQELDELQRPTGNLVPAGLLAGTDSRNTYYHAFDYFFDRRNDTMNVGPFFQGGSLTYRAEIDPNDILPESNEDNTIQTTAPNELRRFKQDSFNVLVGYATFNNAGGDVGEFVNAISLGNAMNFLGSSLDRYVAMSPIPHRNYIKLKWHGAVEEYDTGILNTLNQRINYVVDHLDSITRIEPKLFGREYDKSVWIVPDADLGGTLATGGLRGVGVPGNDTVVLLNERNSVSTNSSSDIVVLAHEFGHHVHGRSHPDFQPNKGFDITRFKSPLGDDHGGIRKDRYLSPSRTDRRLNYMVDPRSERDDNLAGGEWIGSAQYLELLHQFTIPFVPALPLGRLAGLSTVSSFEMPALLELEENELAVQFSRSVAGFQSTNIVHDIRNELLDFSAKNMSWQTSAAATKTKEVFPDISSQRLSSIIEGFAAASPGNEMLYGARGEFEIPPASFSDLEAAEFDQVFDTLGDDNQV